jgi:hypothetical protein
LRWKRSPLWGEREARQRRDDADEGVSAVAPVARRGSQVSRKGGHLEKRAWPPVRQHDGEGVGVLAFVEQEVDRITVDVDEVRDGSAFIAASCARPS